ncbi:MAG: DUF3040 domain-containing protein [Canibacter sp.]
MALSEREQKMLEEMERGFYLSEADVMSTHSGRPRGVNYRMLAIGILVTLLGIGVLIAAVAFTLIWLGVIGFAVMIVGVTRCLVPGKPGDGSVDAQAEGPTAGGSSGSGATKKSSESLNEKMERRWDERMNGDR